MHTTQLRGAFVTLMLGTFTVGLIASAAWSQDSDTMHDKMMSSGLMIPLMDPIKGKQLFASKACVVCHSVNGVGGEDAPPLDASTMSLPMNPFEFAARMWRGAESMVAMQREELGEPIELNGAELANIIAFVHDAKVQSQFSKKDIPEPIAKMMGRMDGMNNGDQ